MISKITLIPSAGLTLRCHSCSLDVDGRILTVVPVEWLNTGGVQIRGEGERNVKSEKKKSRMQMHSGFLANPVSLERPEREPVIWAKKKSLVAGRVV